MHHAKPFRRLNHEESSIQVCIIGRKGGLAKATLRAERFGVNHFRPGQREIIEAVLSGKDVLGVMPT